MPNSGIKKPALSEKKIDAVAGGQIPLVWAAVIVFAAVVAGYTVGSDLAHKHNAENANASCGR